MIDRAIAICTYNRASRIGEIITAVKKTMPSDAQLFVCDDGSTDQTHEVVAQFKDVSYIRGVNKGVGANKNRALFLMQNAAFMCILEDDLKPIESGWFEGYENASLLTGIHMFVRVQEDEKEKHVEEKIPEFYEDMVKKGVTPLYRDSPRGDFTFLTKKVITKVGAFNPEFLGVGFAHGEHANRVVRAGLVGHPNKWIDFLEFSRKFVQIGDTEGGRWLRPKKEVKEEIKRNGAISKKLRRSKYLYHELVFP